MSVLMENQIMENRICYNFSANCVHLIWLAISLDFLLKVMMFANFDLKVIIFAYFGLKVALKQQFP